jgi:hypothetical protein
VLSQRIRSISRSRAVTEVIWGLVNGRKGTIKIATAYSEFRVQLDNT